MTALLDLLSTQVTRSMVHVKKKTKKVWNLLIAFSLRTIKVCRFEIIDGVKYVYCIKHAYNFFSEGTSRVCGRPLTLASMCFLLEVCFMQ